MKHPHRSKKNMAEEISLPRISVVVKFLVPFLIAVAAFCAYAPSLKYDFQFDDLANILKFWNIRHSTFLDLCMQSSRWISYWINTIHYAIGKFDPLSYRCGNVLLHIVNSIGLYTMLYALLSYNKRHSFFFTNSFQLSALTALLFALHPVQTQTISYVIQGQLEGFAAASTLSMILLFILYHITESKIRRALSIILLFIMSILGSGTKEIFIVTPALLVLVDWFFFSDGSWETFKKGLWLHGLLTAVIVLFYVYFLKPTFFLNVLSFNTGVRNNIGNMLTHDPREIIRPLPFFLSQFKVIIHYIFIYFCPLWISVEYDWKLVESCFAPDCLIPLLFLVATAGCFVLYNAWYPRSPAVFAALWFLICIAPRSSFIPSSELLVDYKTYLASCGVLFLIASGIIFFSNFLFTSVRISNEYQSYLQYLIMTLLGASLSYGTYNRNKIWRSPEEFWMNMIENAPFKARAYNNYGVALSEKGRFRESIPYYEKAIKMDINYPDPLNNVAVAYGFVGEVDKAIEVLYKSAQMQPYAPEPFNNLATFYLVKKEYDKVEYMIAESLKRRPHYGKAFINRGKLEIARGNKEAAAKAFKAACTTADADNEEGYRIWAFATMQIKLYKDALEAYTKLCEVSPTIDNYLDRANCYFFDNNFIECQKEYLRLMEQFKNDNRARYNLGETYIRLGKFSQALEMFEPLKNDKNPAFKYVNFRIAVCQQHLGNIKEALRTLALIEQDSASSPDMIENARLMMNQMHQKVVNKIDPVFSETREHKA